MSRVLYGPSGYRGAGLNMYMYVYFFSKSALPRKDLRRKEGPELWEVPSIQGHDMQ